MKISEVEQKHWELVEFIDWGSISKDKSIQDEMEKILLSKPSYEMKQFEDFTRNKIRQLGSVLNAFSLKTIGQYGYYGVGDDGFWDLTAHIFGLGKEEYYSAIDNPELAKKRADSRDFVENFEYILPKYD